MPLQRCGTTGQSQRLFPPKLRPQARLLEIPPSAGRSRLCLPISLVRRRGQCRWTLEDLREIIGAYQKCVTETARRFDGFVAKYMGDGVLIYFGYPQAHEDDAERAVRAGLAIRVEIGQLALGEPIKVRIGLATGLVVVGDLIGSGPSEERNVIGDTPNLAARLQALAEPNAIVIGDGTRRQVGQLFDMRDLGLYELKGFSEPQRAWQVLGESDIPSRFAALRSGATPLIGREEELEFCCGAGAKPKGGRPRSAGFSRTWYR